MFVSNDLDLPAHAYIDPAQTALDQLEQDEIFENAALAVARLPPRQQAAILTDLANLADFSAEPTHLEEALLERGVQLRNYQCHRSDGPKERGRYAALLSIAYRRIRKEARQD